MVGKGGLATIAIFLPAFLLILKGALMGVTAAVVVILKAHEIKVFKADFMRFTL